MDRVRNSSIARSATLGVLALLLVGSAGAAAQAPPLGPLRTSEQNPLYRLYYVPIVEPADPIAEGSLRVDLALSYSNIFERSESDVHRQLFDLERLTKVVTVRYGLTSSLEVGGRAGFQTGWGGFLDPFISAFHGAFGLPNGGREREPEGQYRFYLEREDPDLRLDLAPRTFGMEDVRLFAKWRIRGEAASRSALSVLATVRRASGPLEPGRVAGSAALLGRTGGDDFVLHAGAGVSSLSSPAVLEPVAAEWAGYGWVGLEARIHPRLSAVAQMSGTSAYVSGFEDGELDRFPTTLVVGLAGRSGGRWEWQVGFAEDVPPDSPSVDFTVDLRVGRTF